MREMLEMLKNLYARMNRLDDRVVEANRNIFKNRKMLKNALLFCLSIFIIVVGIGAVWISSFKIPDFTSFEDTKTINSTQIYDRTGKILLYDLNQNVKRV